MPDFTTYSLQGSILEEGIMGDFCQFSNPCAIAIRYDQVPSIAKFHHLQFPGGLLWRKELWEIFLVFLLTRYVTVPGPLWHERGGSKILVSWRVTVRNTYKFSGIVHPS